MSGKETLDRFIDERPLAVMTRAIAEQILDSRLDVVFESCRQRQYDDIAKFSVVALSMVEIALGFVANRNQAYDKFAADLKVCKRAYYSKVDRTETSVSEGIVRYSAEHAVELLDALKVKPQAVLTGFSCYVYDGNHLQKTEHRLAVTRGISAAPLPGTIVGRYDLQTKLFERSYLLEDAHAQESSVLDRVLEDLKRNDVGIFDRHYCIVKFMWDVHKKRSYFVIRQHGRLQGELRGKRKYIGRTKSGKVYEQTLVLEHEGNRLALRRVTIHLDTPTEDGDTELHILTNLPKSKVNACRLADVYHLRWDIERKYYVLTTTLTCELKGNCMPRCALFQFCMAQVAFNCRQVALATLAAEHGAEAVEQMSQYKMACEIAKATDGFFVAVNDQEWRRLVPRTPKGLAPFLRHVAKHVEPEKYRKSVRGAKKPPTPRTRYKSNAHVSTARLLKAT